MTPKEHEQLEKLKAKFWNSQWGEREPNYQERQKLNELHKKYMAALSAQLREQHITFISENSLLSAEELRHLTTDELKGMVKALRKKAKKWGSRENVVESLKTVDK